MIFDFGIEEKQILAVGKIQVNRPAACAIASFNPIGDGRLEVWIRNVLGEATTISVSASVLVM